MRKNVFDLVIEDIFEKYKFTFPCTAHKNYITTSIVTNYLVMRYLAVQENRKEKMAQKIKKLAKLLHV